VLLPLQIPIRNLERSPALETRIRERAQRLERFSAQPVRCRVIVDTPHGRGQQGHLYERHIQPTTPGGEVVATREHRERRSHEDVYLALRDAFRPVRRQLDDYGRKRHRDVKHPEPEPIGRVSNRSPPGEFGHIETDDGRTIYFHRHSLVGGDFDRLTTGTKVRYVEEGGERGPQSSAVRAVTDPGPVS
jgi:cold shock CspA family protein/ribosome-associated translation inhibitor RaiA